MGKNTPTIKTDCVKYCTKVKNVFTNYSNKSKMQIFNITKDKREALHNLKKDNSCLILTVDKRVALVVMDKDTYISKCMTVLSDQRVYQGCKDLPKSIHNKVIKQLSDLKKRLGHEFKILYTKLHPLGTTVHQQGSMDYQKSINLMSPLDP